MNEWLKVIIMGIVEGITEFLPISSTGHLIVVGNLLQMPANLQVTFEIFIQLGAVVAVIAYYWRDIFQQVVSVRTSGEVQRFWLGIVLAFIPAAVVGLLFRDFIAEVLFSPVVVATALMVGGLLLIIIERRQGQPTETAVELSSVTPRTALLIGVAQMLALIPGMSRSAASIVGGLLLGLNRSTATVFSFYLAIPTLGAATVFQLLSSLDEISPNDLLLLLGGAVIAGIVAWAAIRWLLTYIAHHSFIPFGYYRIGVGLLILTLVAAGVIV